MRTTVWAAIDSHEGGAFYQVTAALGLGDAAHEDVRAEACAGRCEAASLSRIAASVRVHGERAGALRGRVRVPACVAARAGAVAGATGGRLESWDFGWAGPALVFYYLLIFSVSMLSSLIILFLSLLGFS